MDKFHFIAITLLLFLLPAGATKAQPFIADTSDPNYFLRKETVYKVFLHSAGFGLGYNQARHKTVYRKNLWEIDILNQISPKEIKSVSPWAGNSKSYVFGKVNYIFTARAGIGTQRLLNRKPYWGGVEVRYFLHGGLSLGFEKPVYLYIINFNPTFTDYFLTTERYNPGKHFYDNIYGRAPFGKGFDKLNVKPGIYGKFGFIFDFGTNSDRVKALEAGGMFDVYPQGITMMSYNDPIYAFVGFYISYDFGKRFNRNQKEELTD